MTVILSFTTCTVEQITEGTSSQSIKSNDAGYFNITEDFIIIYGDFASEKEFIACIRLQKGIKSATGLKFPYTKKVLSMTKTNPKFLSAPSAKKRTHLIGGATRNFTAHTKECCEPNPLP